MIFTVDASRRQAILVILFPQWKRNQRKCVSKHALKNINSGKMSHSLWAFLSRYNARFISKNSLMRTDTDMYQEKSQKYVIHCDVTYHGTFCLCSRRELLR